MNTKNIFLFVTVCCNFTINTNAQTTNSPENLMFTEKNNLNSSQHIIGHSHNDYKQAIPLLTAYHAGMQSIEADVFLENDTLFVAHERSEISTDKTLEKTYLLPLINFVQTNRQHPFPDTNKKLQLVIDIKEDYEHVIPAIEKLISKYLSFFNRKINPHAIQIILSGETPESKDFDKYSAYFQFDGRPEITYTKAQLQRIGMMSQDIRNYTKWNGKGVPTPQDADKLKNIIQKAHIQGKSIRFWATHDSPNTWLVLEKMGTDILNTDHPLDLHKYLSGKNSTQFQSKKQQVIYKPKNKHFTNQKAKNIILLIGDGMGLAQIKAAAAANFGDLSILQMLYIGFSKTEAANSDNTDSAAGGTAIATGKKTNNRFISKDTDGNDLAPITKTAKQLGKHTGIITLGDVTDATPAVFYAHVTDREHNDSIACQFLEAPIDLLIGSGNQHFVKNKLAPNLLSKILAKGYVIQNRIDTFLKSTENQQLVLLADSATKPIEKGRTAWLSQALEKSIDILSKDQKGFLIVTEGAQIDYGGHANNLSYTITELLDFDKAVASALQFADHNGETLVIVTADHETGGLSLLDADQKKGYVHGNFSTNDHTNIMVPVFAYGPGAENFIGIYENTAIYDKMKAIFSR